MNVLVTGGGGFLGNYVVEQAPGPRDSIRSSRAGATTT